MLAMFKIIDKSLAGNCFWGVFKRQEIAETDRLNVVFVAEYHCSIPYSILRDMLALHMAYEVLACVTSIGQYDKTDCFAIVEFVKIVLH